MVLGNSIFYLFKGDYVDQKVSPAAAGLPAGWSGTSTRPASLSPSWCSASGLGLGFRKMRWKPLVPFRGM